MNCPYCQFAPPPGAKFCTQCGTRLPVAAPAQAVRHAGDRRIVTVLFLDVSGFTALSERLDPVEVTALVNRFFGVLTVPIYRYGGVVDKYIGDAIMALFGYPVAHEDDVERALYAAYDMQRAAAEFTERLGTGAGSGLKVRIGVHTGLVVTGAVGGQEKQNVTVMGETVNLAQLMEANAPIGGVLVSEETYRRASDRFEFGPERAVRLRGSERQLTGHELLTPRERPEDQPHFNHPFVGRASELRQLEAAWSEASAGTPRIVRIFGEPGIGKSRLVAQFITQPGRAKPFRLRARCHSYSQQAPYGMVGGLLHHLLGTSPQQARLEVQQALAERCGELWPDRGDRMVDRLGHFLGLEATESDFAALSQEQRRNAALKELSSLMLALAERQPLFLSIEDLQWADDASLQWLQEFLAALGTTQAPILVVLQYRADFESSPVAAILPGLRLPVLPLEASEARWLLAALLSMTPGDLEGLAELNELAGEVARRAEGNPYYLVEIGHTLVESGTIRRVGDRWQIAKPISQLRLPTTIQGAVAAHIDRLPDTERDLLQVGSVLGRSFTEDLLARVSGLEPPIPGLEGLLRRNLLYRTSKGDLAFTQIILQEVAYQSLLLSMRRRLHRRAGTAWEDLYPDRLSEHAPMMAHHFLLAEDFAKGLRYQYLSAGRALELFDLPSAQAAIERTLELSDEHPEVSAPQRWEMYHLKGKVHLGLNQFDEALGSLGRAFQSSADPTHKASILQLHGDIFERQGNYQQALQAYQQALDLLPEDLGCERAPFLSKLGYAKYRLGLHAEALMLCHQALVTMDPEGMPREAGFAHSCIGLCHWRQGNYADAVHHTQEAMRYRERAKDLLGVATSSANLANIYALMGEMERAEACYQQSLQSYERMGDAYWISFCHNNLGTFLVTVGKLADAESHFYQALDLLRGLETKQLLGIVLFNLGDVLSHRANHAQGLVFMQQAFAIFEAIGTREVFPEVYRSIARVLIELEQFEAAYETLDHADRSADELGDPITLGVVARLRAKLALAQGDRDEAIRQAHEAVALLADKNAPLELGRAHAMLWQCLGPEAGSASRLEAEALFTKLGASLDLAALA